MCLCFSEGREAYTCLITHTDLICMYTKSLVSMLIIELVLQ